MKWLIFASRPVVKFCVVKTILNFPVLKESEETAKCTAACEMARNAT